MSVCVCVIKIKFDTPSESVSWRIKNKLACSFCLEQEAGKGQRSGYRCFTVDALRLLPLLFRVTSSPFLLININLILVSCISSAAFWRPGGNFCACFVSQKDTLASFFLYFRLSSVFSKTTFLSLCLRLLSS